MAFDPISFILARKGVKLPTLKDLIIDTDKDWNGYKILNIGGVSLVSLPDWTNEV